VRTIIARHLKLFDRRPPSERTLARCIMLHLLVRTTFHVALLRSQPSLSAR
jgi:hypothetical protein